VAQAYGVVGEITTPAIPGAVLPYTPPIAGFLTDNVQVVEALSETVAGKELAGPGKTPVTPIQDYGTVLEAFDPWFELMHVLPRTLILGKVLSKTEIPMVVHNAYRRRDVLWNDFVNGAGAGTILMGSLPPTLIPKQTSETDLTLVITMVGPPIVDEELGFVFEFDIGTISIPIQFDRLVFFPFVPEGGYTEELSWLTDVMEGKSGKEQRHSLRLYPRQKFDFDLRLLDSELTRLQNFLLSRPGATYGVALWHEQVAVSGTHSIGATVVNVATTSFRDFRVGGLAMIYEDENTYDIFLVDAKGGTTLTPTTPLAHAYTTKAIVVPMRYGLINAKQSGSRYRMKMADIQVSFQVVDIGVDLASAAAFGTFKSKIFIDDDNAAEGGRSEDSIEANRIEVFDPQVGPTSQASLPALARSLGEKGWYPAGVQRLWEVRQLLHALRGRQISFWIATRREDLILTADLTNASSAMDVEATGLGALVELGYRTAIRLTLVDGSVLLRDIASPDGVAVSLDGLTETITLTTTWGSTIPKANVARIEFIQKVRLDSDTVRLRYEPGRDGARVHIPLRMVLD
jgi:hypothetical protein